MILSLISRAYCWIGFILCVIFIPTAVHDLRYFYYFLVIVVSFLLFGAIMISVNNRRKKFYTYKNLILIVFVVAILETLLFKLFSFYISHNTFVFASRDGMLYYSVSVKMAQMSFQEGLDYLSNRLGFGFDDWGVFFLFSIVFRWIASNDFLSLVHCILGVLISIMLFNIGRCFMPRRYAFIAALSFSIASFMILSYATSVKQTMMTFLIVAVFNYFFVYIRTKKIAFLIVSFILILLVFFFRIPTALLLLFSLGLTLILMYMKGALGITLGVFFSLAICSTSFFATTYDRYLRSGDTEAIIDRKNELAGETGLVNQLADPVAALVGPFPSVYIKSIKATTLYAPGLLFRFLLSAPFIAGTYFIIKKRYIKMYSLILFFLMNALGVAISVKGLESRLSIPHLAMAYIVAFWFMAKHDYDKFPFKISNRLVYGYCVVILGFCMLWNLR